MEFWKSRSWPLPSKPKKNEPNMNLWWETSFSETVIPPADIPIWTISIKSNLQAMKFISRRLFISLHSFKKPECPSLRYSSQEFTFSSKCCLFWSVLFVLWSWILTKIPTLQERKLSQRYGMWRWHFSFWRFCYQCLRLESSERKRDT